MRQILLEEELIELEIFKGSFWGLITFDIFHNDLGMKSGPLLVKHRWKALPV